MVVIQEANALGCQSIDVGGFIVSASVASQVGISEVIGQDENDVWPVAAWWVARGGVARGGICQELHGTQELYGTEA